MRRDRQWSLSSYTTVFSPELPDCPLGPCPSYSSVRVSPSLAVNLPEREADDVPTYSTPL
jgi:hypothetical protein